MKKVIITVSLLFTPMIQASCWNNGDNQAYQQCLEQERQAQQAQWDAMRREQEEQSRQEETNRKLEQIRYEMEKSNKQNNLNNSWGN